MTYFKRILILKTMLLLALNSFAFEKSPYFFEGNISERVLRNYLSRSVTMSEYAVPTQFCVDGIYLAKERDTELIKSLGAKFIGRSIFRWGNEADLNNPEFWEGARNLIKDVHDYDPEVIFQAAVFEAVFPAVKEIAIPDWAFKVLGLPIQKRNFCLESMVDVSSRYYKYWHGDPGRTGTGIVPDIMKKETQLWYAFLIGSYIDLGVEAIHLGQVHLTGRNDDGFKEWSNFLQKVRAYASKKSRRKFILFDAHTHGLVIDGVSLLDFNSYPMRMKEELDKPMNCIIEKGYQNSIYGKSKGCITPSGWKCEHLPYLVEFDNDGISSAKAVGVGNHKSHRQWGYDEMSWFYLQGYEGRRKWLEYAYSRVRELDPDGYLQIALTRVLTLHAGHSFVARACKADSITPMAMDIGETVKEIWKAFPVSAEKIPCD